MYVRRASFVLAFTLAALAPSPAAAQQTAARGQNRWAVLVGIEDGPGDSGLQLRGDLEFVQRPLSPVVGFSIVGSVGFTRFSENGGYYDPFTGIDDRWESSVNLLKFGGSARFNFGHHPSVRPYAEGGLGIYYAGLSGSQTAAVSIPTPPYYMNVSQDYSDSEVSLFMHLAAGATFPVSPTFALGVELGFNPYFGDVDETLTSLMASATFRL